MRFTKIIVTASIILSVSTLAFAQQQPSEATRNSASGTATDTGKYQLYNKNGVSGGGYATTTTTGGFNEGGSGQAIPNNTRGSTQSTTGGLYIKKDF